jgi:hypothetical protein
MIWDGAMNRKELGPSGVVTITLAILTAIACGIDYLVEGHLSQGFGLAAGSIWFTFVMVRIHELWDEIRDNTTDTKERLARMEKVLADVKQKVEYRDI